MQAWHRVEENFTDNDIVLRVLVAAQARYTGSTPVGVSGANLSTTSIPAYDSVFCMPFLTAEAIYKNSK